MPFIHLLDPDEAEDGTELAEFYERVAGKRGNVANVHQLASLHPPLGEAHLDLYMSLMYDREAGLDRRRREMIGVAVSRANDCEYCVTHHREALDSYEDDEKLVDALAENPDTADLPDTDRALVDYALKITRKPASITAMDVEPLRERGFDDGDVLAAAIAAYFNFVNRFNLGLGAEIESEEERKYDD